MTNSRTDHFARDYALGCTCDDELCKVAESARTHHVPDQTHPAMASIYEMQISRPSSTVADPVARSSRRQDRALARNSGFRM